ncbi:MAG: YqiA/YcfP family alpha/beta fold hydrolase [Bacteroidaceae bacterium]
MKIVYFHGFGSSGTSGTVLLLTRLLPEVEVKAPDIPVDPAEALPFLKSYCEAEQPDLIIGTSMGGMYAQQMRGFKRICVNPAFNMSKMSKSLKTGEHTFFNRRRDNQKTFRVTKEIIQHYFQMERKQFDGIDDAEREICWGLFGVNDTVVNGYDLFLKYYIKAARFEGEHRLNEKVLKKTVIPLIKEILFLP